MHLFKLGRYSLLVVFIFSSMLFATCRKDTPNCHTRYKIRNNISTVYYNVSSDSELVHLEYNPLLDPGLKVSNGETITNVIHGACLEDYIIQSSTQKLWFFYFEPSVLESTPWDTLKQRYLIIKKEGYTKPQLDSMNWLITYQ